MTIRADAHKPEFHRAAPPQLPVLVATTANITIATALNAGDAIDGVTLAAGNRVLVKDQSTGSQNGIYIVGPTPARSFDMEEGVAAFGALVYVIAGTANGGKLFRNTNATLPTIDTTALTFADYTPGAGGGGAPTTADYLVGTAQAGLSAEIVVGTTPNGELGGTWGAITVDATHSGSSHAGVISTHEAAADPHTGYLKEADIAAKGDLYVGTANDVVGILPVGSNDQIPMAESAEATGIKWVGSQTPTTAVFADAAAEGTADTYARGDHKHGMPAAPAPGTDADGYTVIIATANEDKTNQQYQDHSQFQFPCTAGKHYLVKIELMVSGSDTTGDYGWRFAVAAGTMNGRGSALNTSATLVAEVVGLGASAAAQTGNVATGTPADIDFPEAILSIFGFTPSNTTTFKFAFGNFSAAAARISRTWKGSIFKYKQVD